MLNEPQVQLLEEDEIPSRRLGRHIEHDPRSRAFAFAPPTVQPLVSVKHARRIPILDQGQLGSCTGNAAVGALGTDPLFARLPAKHPTLNETEAVAIYAAATHLDGVAGTYPPDDTGSTGLAVAKAARAAGMIAGYTHTFDLQTLLQALMHQPVIIGINWYSSFDRPSSTGLVKLTSTAYVRGGHEVVLDQLDVSGKYVWFANSWGVTWGLHGRARMGWPTLQRLLTEKGDCTVFTPLP